MIEELTGYSAARLAALIRERAVSPVEVLAAHLDRIERFNPALNAIVTLAPDAQKRAAEAAAAIIRGDAVGPLHGVPVTIKDTIETGGLRTTSGSVLRRRHTPGADAPAVARLKAAGAIILGKTNVPEMALPYESDNPVFGRTNNPHDLARTPGGSSGGCAAAISACLSPGGLGSDLSGSIRVPAHFCGIAGLKPTTGRVPAAGHFPPTEGPFSLGAVLGPMARRVEDLSLLFKALTGAGAADSPLPALVERDRLRARLRGWGAAWYADDGIVPVTPETRQAVRAAAQALADAGLAVREERPPGIERASGLWTPLFSRAGLLQLRAFYAGHEEQAGAFVKGILGSAARGLSTSLDPFAGAAQERASLLAALLEWMKETPLIVAPVGSVPAFEHGARNVEVEGRSFGVFQAFGYSRAFNVLGLPSVALPAGRSPAGLPIGVQVVGRPHEEHALLAAASIIEEALGGWFEPQGLKTAGE